jgi:hypothetical protein
MAKTKQWTTKAGSYRQTTTIVDKNGIQKVVGAQRVKGTKDRVHFDDETGSDNHTQSFFHDPSIDFSKLT